MKTVFILVLLLLGAQAHAAKVCTEEDSERAEKMVANVKTWTGLHRTFKSYGHCEDGVVAESFSDLVSGLLTRNWASVTELADLTKKDRAFGAFVLRQAPRGSRPLSVNVQEKCPPAAAELCRNLANAMGVPFRGSAVLCQGEGYGYALRAPQGWSLGSDPKKQGGHCVAAFLQGKNWESSEAVMYATPLPKNGKTLKEVIDADLARHRDTDPELKFRQGVGLAGKATLSFERKLPKTAFEMVAYAEEPGAVILLVLSAQTRADYEKALPAFREFVRGYRTVAGP